MSASFTRVVAASHMAGAESIATTIGTITECAPVVNRTVMFAHGMRVNVKGPERYQFMVQDAILWI